MTRLYLFYLFIFVNDDDDKNSDVKSIFKKIWIEWVIQGYSLNSILKKLWD